MASNEIASMELPAPVGWKKFIPKDGTPKRNGVIFISPSGEEIRNRRHMDQFLRSHPGGPSPSEFDWGYGDKPRRSVRIREKFKATESPDEDPPVKKQRKLNLGEEKQEMNGEDAEEQEEQGEGKQESNGEDTEEQEEEGEGKLERNDAEEQEEQGQGKQESNDTEEQSEGNQEMNGEDTKEQEEQVDEVPEGKKTDSQPVESIIVDAVMEQGEGNQERNGEDTEEHEEQGEGNQEMNGEDTEKQEDQVDEVSGGKKMVSEAVESIIVDAVMEQVEGKQERNGEDIEEQEEQGEGKQESDGEDAEEHEKQGEGKQERNDTKEQGEGNQEMNGEDTKEQEEQVDEVPEGMKTDSIAVESIIVDAVMKDIEDGSAEAKEENNFTVSVAEDKTTAERVVTVENDDHYSGEIQVSKDQNEPKKLEIEETSKDLPVLSPPEAAEEDTSVLRESKEKLEVESVPEENSAVKEIQVASEVTPHQTESN